MVIILYNSVYVFRTLPMITMDEKIMVSFAEHPQLLEFPSLKAGVGQNIALHALSTATYSSLFYFFLPVLSTSIFSGPLPTQSDAYLYQQFEKLHFYLK